jgi:hypothetical protein
MTITNAYLTRMPVGFVGMVNRQDQALLQPEIIDTSYPPVLYGTVVKMVSGKIRTIASGDAAADVRGFIAKPYPYNETSVSSATLGASGVPNPNLPCDIMKRGYMIVAFAGTTAAKGGQVNVCINTAGGGAIGDITETTDGNNVAIANCFFMGAASGGVVEISYNVER